LLLLLPAMVLLPAMRVVSLSPAITEIIFELEKGGELVGNTSFCNYPPEAEGVKKVGGFLDISLETIVKLRPDIIFHYPEHRKVIRSLGPYANLVEVRHTSIQDLMDSIRIISKSLGVSRKGAALSSGIEERLEAIRGNEQDRRNIKILMVIGRDPHTAGNITVIGKGDFLNEVMDITGGVNAYPGSIPYPSVSIESIIRMDPEVIIEFSFSGRNPDVQKKAGTWKKYSHITAVRKGNVYIVNKDYWVRPGPRVVSIAESMVNIVRKAQ